MADGEVRVVVDYSKVYSAVQDVMQGVTRHIDNNLEIINKNVLATARELDAFKRKTTEKLMQLHKFMIDMDRRQTLAANLQRAITEIIRVRQELEDKFSAQKEVREAMLGILEASDLELIKKNTVSRITEQFMISAPRYWLAPALVALSAWLSDDKALAQRGIKEALKRDTEKTALLFALITRRVNAGRAAKNLPYSDVCFQWLNLYFSKQNVLKMRSSIIAFVDAYFNGVFGNDKDNICGEQVSYWMSELIAKKPTFAEEQRAYWNNYFQKYVQVYENPKFQALKRLSAQYGEIDKYIGRIQASTREDGIKGSITGIVNSVVDTNELIEKIDKQLKKLVSEYEEGEADLRDEEFYLQKVKDFQGDEDRAKNLVNAIKQRRKDDDVDFAMRLSEAITGEDTDEDGEGKLSEKKTAIFLLRPYIENAYVDFLENGKATYPETIDLAFKEPAKIDNGIPFDWSAQTKNAENRDEIVGSIRKKYDSERDAAVAKVTDDEANKKIKNGTIACFFFILLFIPLFIGLSMRKKGKQMLADNAAKRERIKKFYDSHRDGAINVVNDALDARVEANAMIAAFESNPHYTDVIVHDYGDEEAAPAPMEEPTEDAEYVSPDNFDEVPEEALPEEEAPVEEEPAEEEETPVGDDAE